MSPASRIYVALDTTDVDRALGLARTLSGHVGGVKIGKEFFTANGPQGVVKVTALGMPVFLDFKFHDIPNTVASAIRAALPLKPAIINVHAQGGPAMLEAAAKAAAETGGGQRPLVLAVTILTSIDDSDLRAVGISDNVSDQVVRLARLAQKCGIDGVVCSAHEIDVLREACGADFKLLVPGIRPDWAASGDQKRVMSPREAVKHGADYLVIGRPITGADNSLEAAQRIAEELEGL